MELDISWLQWGLGILATLLIPAAGAWASGMYRRISEIKACVFDVSSSLKEHAAKITVEVAALKDDVREIKDDNSKLWIKAEEQATKIARLEGARRTGRGK